MKRLFLSICALVFMISVANAQLFKFGIKAGVSSSRIKFDTKTLNNGTNDYEIKSGDALVGMHFGFVSRVQLLGLFVQPELYFSSTGGDVKIKNITANTETIKKQKFSRIDIPVLVGWKFGPARVGVGPVASIIIADKAVLKEYTGYEEQFNKATFGYQVGVGLDLWKLGVDLRYEGSLSKLGDGVKIGGQTRSFDSRNSQVLASVSLYF
ncbi:porin family protein [Williamwhitmania taraxaci]|uniref:Outer membrane protein beta-barrel domain-containing protein n=1 Tax=Williamwhitmania taraxaci TaxID=1640674 RepID=A0A1G6HJ42_9BACT|nr:porin family protein [Williamwhitmania taraxaci]SDB94118.1 Outer membrane protein beta-barrel domain-containing protein [Williamwhitmania taraxaci]